jgi:2-amino-4-hydroxy-6-hydroxymethyldihydropteridine diphosphokinase
MREPVAAFVGLGANLGDPRAALAQALQGLAALPGTRLVRSSRVYRSAPVDAAGPDYFNAVAELETTLDAPQLLRGLQVLEHAAGRERPYRNAPRTLDLDLLLYGSARIASAALTVPHPRMRERAFVLLPLAELAPQRVDAADLAAVADQRIAPLPGTSSTG